MWRAAALSRAWVHRGSPFVLVNPKREDLSTEVPREVTSSPSSGGTYRMALERADLTDEVAISGLGRGHLLGRKL